MTNRVIAFIDGFNVYHALDRESRLHKYKWLNLSALPSLFIKKKNDSLKDVYFFTALAHWNPDRVRRHKEYLRALEDAGVKIVQGQFKKVTRNCRACNKRYQTFEEKETDVNIALYLFRLASEDRYDTALLFSADSDLLPAIRAVRGSYGTKKVVAVIPIGGRAEAIKHEADGYMRMKEKHLKSSQFPDTITTSGGAKLHRPAIWK